MLPVTIWMSETFLTRFTEMRFDPSMNHFMTFHSTLLSKSMTSLDMDGTLNFDHFYLGAVHKLRLQEEGGRWSKKFL